MKIEDLVDPPKWLQDAITSNADVEITGGVVHWKSGEWYYGTFENGYWYSGTFCGGIFRGYWKAGQFNGGSFQAYGHDTILFYGGTWDIGNKEGSYVEQTLATKVRNKVREKIKSNGSVALALSIFKRLWDK